MLPPTHEHSIFNENGQVVPLFPKLTLDGTHWAWPDGTVLPRVRGGSDIPPGPDPAGVTLTDPSRQNGGDPRNQPPGPPAGSPPGSPAAPTYYTEEQMRDRLNAARTEERDKLYSGRQQEQQELSDLRAWRTEQERLKTEHDAEAQRQADEQRRAQEAEELSAKDLIARREVEWRTEQEAQRAYFEGEIARRDALMEKERQFADLMTYRERVVAANAEHILPELHDYITGDSQQAIDAAVERAIERTQSVLQNFRAVGQEQQRQAPGVSTRAPATGPEAMAGGQRTYSVEDIKGWSMSDYQQYRDQLPPGRAGQSDRGLF